MAAHDSSQHSDITRENEKVPSTSVSSLSSYLKVEVSPRHADLVFLACCVVSGLCDSSVYASWQCFVSMQTGNTVFLALGASGQPTNRPYGWLKSLTSIVFFMIGCIVFIQVRRIGPLRRGTLGISFLLQTLCLFIAAALVQANVIRTYDSYGPNAAQEHVHFNELIPLALLAFQSGGQMAASRLFGFGEIPTTVLTSVYCDFITDQKLLTGVNENVKRNRRFGAITTFLIGAICGGWLARSTVGISVALWISGGIKLLISLAWFLWKADERIPV